MPDLMAVTETRLTSFKDAKGMDGYSFECVNSPTQAGGVGIYISDNNNYSLRDDLQLNLDNCEDIWLNVELQDKSIVVGVIYRHPGHKYGTFCDKLCNTLNILNMSKSNYIIVGDINIDLLKFNLVSNVTEYVNSLYSVGCNVAINKPTRVTSHGSSCIDHVYSNFTSNKLDTGILLSDVSDHYSTLTCVNGLRRVKKNYDVFVRKSDLNEEEWDQFNVQLYNKLNSEAFFRLRGPLWSQGSLVNSYFV